MDTKAIRYFQIAYEEKGINQAAGKLFISPQGLSKSIQNLEKELDTQLFIRTKKGLIPTETGDYFYRKSSTILHQLDKIQVEIKNIDKHSSLFHLGFAHGVINVISPDYFMELKRNFPNIEVQCDEKSNERVIEGVKNGKLEAGFAIGPIADPDLASLEVFSCKVSAMIYEGHPFYDRTSLSIEDLKGQPLICLNEDFSIFHGIFRRCQDFGFLPDIVLKTFESSLIYRFTKEKMGIGIDVNIHKGDELLGNLHRIEITDSIPWRISLISRKDSPKSPILDILWQRFSPNSSTPSAYLLRDASQLC